MKNRRIRILLIDDNAGDVRLIQELLAEAGGGSFQLAVCDRLASGLERLNTGAIDAVLLNLAVPDSRGLATFTQLRPHVANVPIVVLTGLVDEELAKEAVRQGAQDYLLKGQVDSKLLVRALRYAIECHRLQVELRHLSLTDELTALYNRRGFVTLAEHQLRLARRTKMQQLLLFADLDGLKQINDTLGHDHGDQALFDVANILRRTCRQSDIIARLGGGEYVVLAINGVDGAPAITTRLEANLKVFQEKMARPYKLSLSIGVAVFDPNHPCFIEELLVQANTAMHLQKQHNKPQQ